MCSDVALSATVTASPMEVEFKFLIHVSINTMIKKSRGKEFIPDF